MAKHFTFKNILLLGLLVVLGATFQRLLKEGYNNFDIFANATRDFFDGIMPYTQSWRESHSVDFYLYPPQFNVLFAPFAFAPMSVGPYLWNVFNFLMLAWAIWLLPHITTNQKRNILFFLLPIITISVLSMQYNMVVCYIFLFSYSLLERGKGHWAMLLIMLSVFTKIYGGVELLLVLFYPKFWRNVLWGTLWAGVMVALPLVELTLNEYATYLGAWAEELPKHQGSRRFETIFDMRLLWDARPWYQIYVQAGVFFAIVALTFARYRWWGDKTFRVGTLASVMGFAILFSNASEKHTYLIALAGWIYWWSLKSPKIRLDYVLYWMIFAVLCIVPIDIVVPKEAMQILLERWDLNQWVFLCGWIYLLYNTFIRQPKQIIYEKKC